MNEPYHGSVKTIYPTRARTPTAFGEARMVFGNDYSVYDTGGKWNLPGRAEDLGKSSAQYFTLLDHEGIPHHVIERVGPTEFRIHLAMRPTNYDQIERGKTTTYLIPIEYIFSRTVTPVSSLHRALRTGGLDPADYGLGHRPARDEVFVLPRTRVRYSTKIESTDRYTNREELERVAGLIGDEFDHCVGLTERIGDVLIAHGKRFGITVGDGKFEYIMAPDRRIIVGDTGLSWDECRWLVDIGDGTLVDVSKQMPRDYYMVAHPEWIAALKAAQKEKADSPDLWPDPPEMESKWVDLCTEACHLSSDVIIGEGSLSDLQDLARRRYEATQNLQRAHGRHITGEDL